MEAAARDTSYSIGEALNLLQQEFPDVSISKIRFLESKGLIAPERTAAGFRRFQQADIDRLVAILKLQRDQYLPLAVIREHFTGETGDQKPSRRGRNAAKVRHDQPSLGLEGEDAPQEQSEEDAPGQEQRRLRMVPDPDLPAPSLNGHATEADPPTGPAAKEQTISEESGLELLVASTATAFANMPLVPGADKETKAAKPAPDAETPEPLPESREPAPKAPKRRKRAKTEAVPEPAKAVQEDPNGRLDPEALIAQAGITPAFLAELEQFGIVRGTKTLGTVSYDARQVELAKVARGLDGMGLTPRHLKSLRVSVEKEFGLIEQLLATQLGAGGARARRKTAETAQVLEELSEQFRRLLLSQLIAELIEDKA